MSVIYLFDLAGVLFGPVALPVVPGIGVQMPDNAISLVEELAAPADGFVWALAHGSPVELADNRGTVYSTETGEPHDFKGLGSLPSNFTPYPPPSSVHAWISGQWQVSPQLVAELRAKTEAGSWALIKDERDRRSIAGIMVGSLWVHSDLFSRSQWLGLKDNARDALAAGRAMTDGLLDSDGQAIVWKMLDGAFLPVTAQMAFDVVAAVTRSDIALFTFAEQHNSAMRAATDPAAYDYTTGWPKSYAEWASTPVLEPEIIPPVEPEPAEEVAT